MNQKAEQEDVDSLEARVLAKLETLAREMKVMADEHNDRLEAHEMKIQENDPTRAFEQITQLQKNAEAQSSEMKNIRADTAMENIRIDMKSQAEDINVINERWSTFEEINKTNQEILDDLTSAVTDNKQVD